MQPGAKPSSGLFHRLFGTHIADPELNRWDRGHFVSNCGECGCAMVRLPGLPWRVGSSN